MIKSMTGYGRSESSVHGRTLTVEVKSVNNRYLDCSVRLPRVYICAEDGVQRRVKQKISRGKVDVYVNIENTSEDAVSVTLNQSVAAGYLSALRTMKETFQLQGELSVGLVFRMCSGWTRCRRIWSSWRQIFTKWQSVRWRILMGCVPGKGRN